MVKYTGGFSGGVSAVAVDRLGDLGPRLDGDGLIDA